MTAAELEAAAHDWVARTTAAQGLTYFVEDRAVLSALADAVIDATIARRELEAAQVVRPHAATG